MTRSGSDVISSQQLSKLVNLADLAGIKGPGNTMRIVMELFTMGVPPKEVIALIRRILVDRYRNGKSQTQSRSI